LTLVCIRHIVAASHCTLLHSDQWLPTKAAADALGISTDTLKRKRDICGGFLKPGLHWCAGATKNSSMTWCVERCREAFHQQGVEARKIEPPVSARVTDTFFELSRAEVMHVCKGIASYEPMSVGPQRLKEAELTNSIWSKFQGFLSAMSDSSKVTCRCWQQP